MYTVQFASKRVKKELAKFDEKEKGMIQDALQVLMEDPRPAHLQFGQLNKNKDVKRIKCKRVRLFYMIDETNKVVQIGKIENRDSKSYAHDPRDWFATA